MDPNQPQKRQANQSRLTKPAKPELPITLAPEPGFQLYKIPHRTHNLNLDPGHAVCQATQRNDRCHHYHHAHRKLAAIYRPSASRSRLRLPKDHHARSQSSLRRTR
ncbi:hypothetical protein MRX96_049061 [Rhipicephalus microplus]